jgi:hypothetical protein
MTAGGKTVSGIGACKAETQRRALNIVKRPSMGDSARGQVARYFAGGCSGCASVGGRSGRCRYQKMAVHAMGPSLIDASTC